MVKKRKLRTNFTHPIVVFDTETGGLNSDVEVNWNLNLASKIEKGTKIEGTVANPAAPVLEIAAVVLSPITLKEIDYFHTYVGPDNGQTLEEYLNLCHPKALSVNGFNKGERREALKNAPTAKEALKDWVNWLQFGHSSPQKFLPCGQNVRFDIDMINSLAMRSGVDFQFRTNHILELIAYSLIYFSLPNTGTVANYKLTTIAECLGIPTDQAHTALADVRMTADCLRIFLKEFTG